MAGAIILGLVGLGFIPITNYVTGETRIASTLKSRQLVTMPVSGTVRIPVDANDEVKPGDLEHDQQVGYDIVVRACRAPLTSIAGNAGKDGGVVCEKVADAKGANGYNAATDTYEDLVKAGVIDPVKVTRTALQNAASVATLLLTSDALIADAPKKDKKGAGAPGMDDMY